MARSNTQGLVDGLESPSDQLNLTVKFSPRQSYMFDVGADNTVKQLKEMVAERAKVTANNINLVLAGHILGDQKTLQACDLGSHTTLHAFCWSDDGLAGGSIKEMTPTIVSMKLPMESGQQTGSQHDLIGESSVDGELAESCVDGEQPTFTPNTESISEGNVSEHSSFFVYCKLCACIQRARLRVKCRQCDSGAFLVDKGPAKWEDISYNTSVRGMCQSCGASVPTFYLRCIQGHPGEVTGTAALLKHVRINKRRVECIICADVSSHILVFPCVLGHVICLDCFTQYCASSLNERRFVEHPEHGYTVPCPAGCEDSHVEDNHHFLLMGKDKYERYKNFGAEEFVLQNGGLLCPGQSCGAGLFPAGEERTVRCQECQFESCRECRREAHPGSCEDHLTSQIFNISDLEVDEERAARACWDRQSLSLIEETTKACPNCKTRTERTGGCMHMVCSRCGEEWCWICVKQWNRNCQGDHWFG